MIGNPNLHLQTPRINAAFFFRTIAISHVSHYVENFFEIFKI